MAMDMYENTHENRTNTVYTCMTDTHGTTAQHIYRQSDSELQAVRGGGLLACNGGHWQLALVIRKGLRWVALQWHVITIDRRACRV